MHKRYPSLCLALAACSAFFLIGVMRLQEALPVFHADTPPKTISLQTPAGPLVFRLIARLPTSFWLTRAYYVPAADAYAPRGTMTLSPRHARAFVHIFPEAHVLAVLDIRASGSLYSCPIDAPFGADAVTRNRCLKYGDPGIAVMRDATDTTPTLLTLFTPTSWQDKHAMLSMSLYALAERFRISRYFSQSIR